MYSADKTLRIFLVRHGQSVMNLEQRLSGQAHTVLSEKGKAQALALRDVLKSEPVSAIYSSSLHRALQTAQPTAEWHGLPVQPMDELREIGLGVLEGRFFDARDQEASSLWAKRELNKHQFNAPGGEAYSTFAARVLSGLATILAKSNGAIVIVGHRNTNELILAHWLSRGRQTDQTINIKNKYLYVLEYGNSTEITSIRLGGECHGQHYQGLRTC